MIPKVTCLSDYSILHKILLTEMSGRTFQLDQAEWISNRRAAELQEI
jgi:frataxin-like iron-binding protein CyaY